MIDREFSIAKDPSSVQAEREFFQRIRCMAERLGVPPVPADEDPIKSYPGLVTVEGEVKANGPARWERYELLDMLEAIVSRIEGIEEKAGIRP